MSTGFITAADGNISFDKLLGGSELEVKRIYAYEESAMVVGNEYKGAH